MDVEQPGISQGVFERRDGIALGILLVGAAAIRAFAWSRTAVMFNDGPIFLAMADALRAGDHARVLAHPQHPFYPVLVAIVEGLCLEPESAAVAVSIFGGMLSVAAVFWIAHRRFGSAIAWSSGAIIALHPWAVDFSADILSDGLHAGLFLAGLACLVELLERPSALRAVAFGFFAGLAYWTRPEGLVLAAAAVVALIWQLATARVQGRSAMGSVGLAIGVLALFVGGLGWAEGWKSGGIAVSQKKSVSVLIEGGPTEAAIAMDRKLRREARRDPDALPLPEGSSRATGRGELPPERSLAGVADTVVRVLATSLSAVRYEVVLFALIGGATSFAALRRSGRIYERVALATGLLQAAILLLLVWGAGYLSRRHALAPGLAFCPLAAVGWQAVLQGLDARFGQRTFLAARLRRGGGLLTPHACSLILIGVLILCWGPRDLRDRRSDRIAERRAAEWLATQTTRVRPVAAQKGRTAYYAGADFVPLPDGRDGETERQLRGRRAGYVIIDRANLGDHLGLSEGIGAWLVPIHVERAPGQEVLVLELSPQPAG